MGQGVVTFKNMTIARQPGELARFRVLGGPDHGVVFVATVPNVIIGRGEESNVTLSDLKASRKHAEVSITGALATLKDLGSANGVLVNGVPFKQIQLKSGDKIGLGETVLEFIGTDLGATQVLRTAPNKSAAVVGSGISGLTQFVQRPVQPGLASHATSISGVKGGGSFVERNRKVLLSLGALMALAALLPQVEQKQREKRNRYIEPKELEAGRSLSSYMPLSIDENALKNADIYFREGFREYRARNYLRAQIAFETSLQIYGDHALSRIYLQSTKKAI
ncbi:MAG: FHA domain-containing protein, partial [Bdellovibrionota bacterium]